MPGNFVTVDGKLGDLEKSGNVKEWMGNVASLIFMLLEELRYILDNLGMDNFNDEELKILSAVLTEPVTIRIKNAEGEISTLNLSAEKLASQVDSVAGDVSTLTQTAKTLQASFQSQEGKITNITASISGLGITSRSGASSLSDIALWFYDNGKYEVPGSLGFDSEKGNVIGRVEVNDEGPSGSAKYRLFVGTGRGYEFNGIGYDIINYALKLESAGSTSYESKSGTMDLAAKGYVHIRSTGGGRVDIAAPNGTWYQFRNDGIYFNGKRIVDATKEV